MTPRNGPVYPVAPESALPRFLECLRSRLPALKVEPATILGRVDAAGVNGGLPSSAARLKLGRSSYWAPWPATTASARDGGYAAPIFLWGGREMIFPAMRVRVEGPKARWEFLSLDQWLCAAFTEWTFPRSAGSSHPLEEEPTIDAWLGRVLREAREGGKQPTKKLHRKVLRVIGIVMRYALNGSEPPGRQKRLNGIGKRTGLRLPQRDTWLRKLDGDDDDDSEWLDSRPTASLGEGAAPSADAPSDFQRECARGLMLTSVVKPGPKKTKRQKPPREGAKPQPDRAKGVPRRGTSRKLEWVPATDAPRGIDPYHTSEGENIRRRLHMALGAKLTDKRALDPGAHEFSLSLSTAQIPFAGYDDPRRLLLAAKAQAKAARLCKPERPLVVTPQRRDGMDPPGVNLRIAYAAWAGWNHEDAWVISRTAAEKLACERRWVQTIAVPALADFEVLVQPGEDIRPGQALVRQFCSPAFLSPALKSLAVKPQQPVAKPPGPPPEIPAPWPLLADKSEKANHAGKVERVEVFDLFRGKRQTAFGEFEATLPDVQNETRRAYRAVIRVHCCRRVAAGVGDKLANRHGHKGVIGLILPDDRMPLWQGQPVEALVDPISVINRGNWGQLYETIAGAVAEQRGGPVQDATLPSRESLLESFRAAYPCEHGPDEQGRCLVEVSSKSLWFKLAQVEERRFRAIVGTQFVMRMPEFAGDKLSASPRQPRVKERKARMDPRMQMALWAHGKHAKDAKHGSAGSAAAPTEPKLSAAAKRLGDFLWLAGVGLSLKRRDSGTFVVLKRLDLSDSRPDEARAVKLAKATKGNSVASQLKSWDTGARHAIELKPPLEVDAPDTLLPWKEIRWIPVLSSLDVENPTHDGSGHARGRAVDSKRTARRSALAKRLEELCKEIVQWNKAGARARPDAKLETKLLQRLRRLLRGALRKSVGANHASMKESWLVKSILGEPMSRSGRAVIVPSGLLAESTDHGPDELRSNSRTADQTLGLCEIGLPEALARAVSADKTAPRVWLKRDPVLHRWGVLPVRFRVHKDRSTIRLPASLLGPLAADFDGDDAAVFAVSPEDEELAEAATPSRIAKHTFGGKPMFLPGKQYAYGLHLLATDPRNDSLLRDFQKKLTELSAPAWPVEQGQRVERTQEAAREWSNAASNEGDAAQGQWWAEVEKFALLGLAVDPGMGLGLPSTPKSVADLTVVQCQAAKADLYKNEAIGGENDRNRRLAEGILSGNSLKLIEEKEGIDPIDPIGEIMAAAVAPQKSFGDEVRRLVLKAHRADFQKIMAAQTLTEQLMQSVLSVKALGAQLPDPDEYGDRVRSRWIPENDEEENENAEWDNGENHNAEIDNAENHNGEGAPPDNWDDLCEPLKGLIERLQADGVLAELDGAFDRQGGKPAKTPCWLKWLFAPHELLELLGCGGRGAGGREIACPIDDLRCGPFLASQVVVPERASGE